MSEDKSRTIPSTEDIRERIRNCREEIKELKKMLRLSQAIEKANGLKAARDFSAVKFKMGVQQ